MKMIVLAAVCAIAVGLCVVSSAGNNDGGGDSATARILMVVAPRNFRDEELFVPKRMFRKSGYKVVVASSKRGALRGMLGGRTRPDISLNDVNVSDYLAVVFVGGSGSTVYYDNKTARSIAQETVKQGKLLAAICLAPGILAKAGLLKGVKATSFSTALPVLQSCGAKCAGTDLVKDGLIITANGPKAAARFAALIIKTLQKKVGPKFILEKGESN